jgi:CBS domain-containing protein
MISAKEIMTTSLMTVEKDTELNKIIKILVENSLTALPVVDEDMTLLGIVSEKDVLDTLINPKSGKKIAGHLMTKDVTCFDEDTNLIEIFQALVNSSFRRVPILSDGRLAGVISRRDIIRFLSKQMGI